MKSVAVSQITPGTHVGHDGVERFKRPWTVTSVEPTIGGSKVILHVARGQEPNVVTGSWVADKDYRFGVVG